MGHRSIRRAPRRKAWGTALALVVLTVLVGVVVVMLRGAESGEDVARGGEANHSPSATPSGSHGASGNQLPETPEASDNSSSSPGAASPEAASSPSADDGPRSTEPVPPPSPDPVKDQAPPRAVASKDGVTVGAPRPKSSGDGMWVSVEITNQGEDSATYEVEIRVTGAGGFNATVRAMAGVLAPGEQASQAHTAMDTSGTPVPERAEVSIVSVTRTPS